MSRMFTNNRIFTNDLPQNRILSIFLTLPNIMILCDQDLFIFVFLFYRIHLVEVAI